MVSIESAFTESALEFTTRPGLDTDFLDHPECLASESQPLAAYLVQLEEEGYASRGQDCLSVAWEDLYRLLDHPDHASSLPLLALPPLSEFRPALSSHGALSDADFGIFLDGWRSLRGAPVRERVERLGATVKIGTESRLLPEAGWRLLEAIRAFSQLPAGEKTRDRNFREWGRIRALARQANAGLDHFLKATVVLTPKTLQLRLHQVEDDGMRIVEVEPTFADAPDT